MAGGLADLEEGAREYAFRIAHTASFIDQDVDHVHLLFVVAIEHAPQRQQVAGASLSTRLSIQLSQSNRTIQQRCERAAGLVVLNALVVPIGRMRVKRQVTALNLHLHIPSAWP